MKSSPPQGAPPPPGRGRPAIAPPEPFNQFTLRRGTGASCGAVRHYAPNLAGAPRLRRTKVPPVWHDRRAPDTLSPVIHAAPRVPAPGRAPVPPCCSSSTPPLPHALPGARPPAKGPEWQYWLTLGPVKGHQATGPQGHQATDCSKPSVAAGAQNSNPKIELRVMSLLACNDVFQALGPQSRPCLVCGAPHSIRSNLLRCWGATCGMDNQDDI